MDVAGINEIKDPATLIFSTSFALLKFNIVLFHETDLII